MLCHAVLRVYFWLFSTKYFLSDSTQWAIGKEGEGGVYVSLFKLFKLKEQKT